MKYIILLVILFTILFYILSKSYKENYNSYTYTNQGSPIYPFPDVQFELVRTKNTGCAKFRKPFDIESYNKGEKQTSCLNNNGNFIQICSDKNGNVIDCRNDPYYITDIGYCNCYNYTSKSQNKDVIYKGNYCQYNDNDNCFGIGIVDDKGICDFSSIDIRKFSEISNINDLNDGDYVILEYLNTDVSTTNYYGILSLNSYQGSGKYISYTENPSKTKEDINNYKNTYLSGPIEEYSDLLNPLTISNKNIIVFQVNNLSNDLKTLKILGTNNYLSTFMSIYFYGYENLDDIKKYSKDYLNVFIGQKIQNISSLSDKSIGFYSTRSVLNPNNVNVNNIFSIGNFSSPNPLSYNKNIDAIYTDFTDKYNSMWWKILKYKKD